MIEATLIPLPTACTIGRIERYVIHGGRAGYDRLLVLARQRWPDTASLFAEIGVTRGMRCLDLGCGGGAVTFELAGLVAPGGHVTGIDMDGEKLALARDEAHTRGLENVEFRHANVNEWDEPGTYDLVYSRLLLQHLSDPLDLLARMWQAVRAGGTLAVEDADFDGLFCDPPDGGYAFWAQMYPAVLSRNGGDPQLGRKLYRMFLEVGATRPELRVTQEVDVEGDTKALPLMTVEATADAIREAGLASEDEIRAAVESLTRFTDDPTTLVGGPRIFQVWARRS